ncbi:hypothetical protein CYY_006678 [Polysphondylium violaceum]|uniref:Uncharacterized protein n=1 Tax=Polysphondylium violaceum TaxID=133409 RepID=A0A8J4UY39_9MYCE|nr:hypothetical protein CYY_006678 [Polysphondylium violaceum]
MSETTPKKRKFHDEPIETTTATNGKEQHDDKRLKSETTDNSSSSSNTASSATDRESIKARIKARLEERKKEANNVASVITSPPLSTPSPTTTEPTTSSLKTSSPTTTTTNTTTTSPTTTTSEENQNDESTTSSMFFDPRIQISTGKKKKFDSFTFVKPGKYTKKAEKLRSQAIFEELKKQELINQTIEQESPTHISDPVPDIEWWDKDLTIKQDDQDTQQQDNNNNNINYKDILNSMDPISKLDTEYWSYIEHPVQIAPIINTYKPAAIRPDFLLLTKEKKKIRKQRREEAERERQERVLNGLEPPPENRVKLSNLMRVITNKGIQDPTQAVLEVTKKMEERRAVHDASNQERKLTKEQKKEKKVHKLIDDSAKELYCAIFKITDLSHPLLRSKVTKTAKDNMVSGTIIFHRCMNLVILEAGAKAMKQCKKLLNKRIDWANPPPLRDNQTEEMNKEENAIKYPQAPPDTINACTLIWEGPIHKPRFTNFVYEFCPLESQARKYLQEHNVPHFWDMAKNFISQ